MSSREVAEAVGVSPKTERDAEIEQLDAELAPLRALEQKARRRAQLEAEQTAAQQQKLLDDLQTDAGEELDRLVRAITGEMTSIEQDDARVLHAAQAYVAAMETLDARFLKIRAWIHAVRAVCAAFGVDLPDCLPTPVVPAQRRKVDEARVMVAHAPARSTGYIREALTDGHTGQRTFAELDDAEARDLIRRKLGR